jgi:hypothetical protein
LNPKPTIIKRMAVAPATFPARPEGAPVIISLRMASNWVVPAMPYTRLRPNTKSAEDTEPYTKYFSPPSAERRFVFSSAVLR